MRKCAGRLGEYRPRCWAAPLSSRQGFSVVALVPRGVCPWAAPRSIKRSVYLRLPQMRILEAEAWHFGTSPADISKRWIDEHIRCDPELAAQLPGPGCPKEPAAA